MMKALSEAQFQVLTAKPRVSGNRIATILSMQEGPVVDFPGNPLGPHRARVLASIRSEMLQEACDARLPVLVAFEQDDPARPIIIDVVVDHPASPIVADPADASVAPDRDAKQYLASSRLVHSRLAHIVGIENDLVTVDGGGREATLARTAIPLRNLQDPVVLLSFEDGSSVIVGQVFSFVPVEGEGGEGADVLLKGTRVLIEADEALVLKAGSSELTLDARGKVVTTGDQIVSRARGANKVQGGSVQLN
jgi:hypothetical protein